MNKRHNLSPKEKSGTENKMKPMTMLFVGKIQRLNLRI
jgi:hypothetical protein